MEIKVFIEQVLPAQKFVSKKDGSTISRYTFIGRYRSGQYDKKVCFSCIGDERWTNLNVVVGREYEISFDLDSREWNGRWYTDVMVWKAVMIGSDGSSNAGAPAQAPAPAQAQVQQPNPQPQYSALPPYTKPASPAPSSNNDLPF